MENIIEKLQALNASPETITEYFIKNGDEELPIEKAKGKTGLVITKTSNRKDEILQLLLNKKRMDIQDFQVLVDTMKATIENLWNDSGYKFKKDNADIAKKIANDFKLNIGGGEAPRG